MYFISKNLNEEKCDKINFCIIDESTICTIDKKYDIEIISSFNRKYKCTDLSRILKENRFIDVYINEIEGRCYCFGYAENKKDIKNKILEIIKKYNLEEYFEKVEVKEIESM